jgi:hypothetical protein
MTYRIIMYSIGKNKISASANNYAVTDEPTDYLGPAWPNAASFHVSQRHDQETQLRRAREYCDYLNSRIVIQPPIGK